MIMDDARWRKWSVISGTEIRSGDRRAGQRRISRTQGGSVDNVVP